jgi:ribose-phosphate pyrophosphokinase
MAAFQEGAPAEAASVAGEKRLMLFTGRANPALAAATAKELGVELGAVTLKTFTAGEVYCRFDESVHDADVFIIQPTCANAHTGVTPNDALVELLLMVDAAVGASARRVIAVLPWFGYSRQDKKSALREPISARLMAHLLQTAGADRVLTVDLHAVQVQGFFTKPVDHMSALLPLSQYFAGLQLDDLVVVSPDVGRVKLNHKFAEMVGADLALMTKERPAQQVAEIGYVIGDVRGKTAVIVDDIIDTAGTLRAAAQTVLDAGAARVYAAGTHGLFSGNAFETLGTVPFEQIVVTDTVPLGPGAPENVVVIPLAPLIADSITQIFTGGSVSEAFAGANELF